MGDHQYAILRLEKLKSFGNIGGSLSHTYRTRETLNADPNRLNRNLHSVDKDDVVNKIKARLPEKRRKDAVLALEYLITASPEFFVEHKHNKKIVEHYFSTSLKWLYERHGSENVVSWHIHDDETSPHLVAYVVPIDKDGRLNAKSFTGGRAVLSKMQTDFAQKVAAQVNLERGVEGSKAKHTDIKDYYAALSNPQPFFPPQLSKEELAPKKIKETFFGSVESLDTRCERVNETILERFNSVSWVNYASVSVELKKRLESAKSSANEAEKNKIRVENKLKKLEAENKKLSVDLLLTQRELEALEKSFEKQAKDLKQQYEISDHFRERVKKLEAESNRRHDDEYSL